MAAPLPMMSLSSFVRLGDVTRLFTVPAEERLVLWSAVA